MKQFHWLPVTVLGLVLLALHLYANPLYGFHRDELLYLTLGLHPDWGYFSVPPFIGWLAGSIQPIFGPSVGAVRFFPTLAIVAVMILTALMAREMGAGRYGQWLAALGIALGPAYLRTGMLFQPVVFDVFFWTLGSWFLVRYLRSHHPVNLYGFAVALGIGMLNKYLIGVFLLALIPALLISSESGVFRRRDFWLATGLALIIVAPNLFWQWNNGLPIVAHMRMLRENQLVNVSRMGFLIEQLLLYLGALLLWTGGLWYLLRAPVARPFRALGWTFLLTLAWLVLLQGKSYYSLGVFPMVIAAGAVIWEQWLRPGWLRWAFPGIFMVIILPLLPLGVPLLRPPQMAIYSKWMVANMGLGSLLTWEDGQLHDLPQDYADMLGWEELTTIVSRAYSGLPEAERASTPIYCENYGQASAVAVYGKRLGLPMPVSFNETFLFWAPEDISISNLIYVNDELGEDVAALFADIQIIGSIQNPLAREQGTTVYRCKSPRNDPGELWSRRLREMKAELVPGR
ncbi:MAG: glycosyltransferase family 39 protein [Lewinellaceae bacterium]|nr:glycosyltransferase family 39 protein [Lewinellaceae bacterium]